MKSAVIVSYARTPIGKFRGSLSQLTAPQLGSAAIKGALSRLGGGENNEIVVQEAFMGNVVSAGIGQAPCRQAVLGANLPQSTICTTINKVCASGMKCVMLASRAIEAGALTHERSAAILAGGMESMSNVPHYLPNSRSGVPLGNCQLLDGVIHDGLWDIYNDQHMGMCAEKCSRDHQIPRHEQDAYATESYRRAIDAVERGVFSHEMEGLRVPQKRGDPILVTLDEELASVNLDKLPTLKPAFDTTGNGTVTAANASSLNDGAAAIILMDEDTALEMGLRPLARIRGYGDAEQDPVDFTTTPSLAVPVALKHAGMNLSDVDYHEINEAFAVVALANMKLLNLDPSKVNVFGGAVALGHPIGMSGTRIVGTLYNVLQRMDATIGCASICNGGGGASAIVIERLN